MTTPTSMGCHWWGIDQREHMQQWKPPAGWHKWTQPTQEQIKGRMRARRSTRTERIRHTGPDTKFCVLCLSGEHQRIDDEE